MIRTTGLFSATVLALAVAGAGGANAESYNFRMASGHASHTGYVVMMSKEFAPRFQKKLEVLGHKATFNEAYGGSLVKVAETLEGVQDKIVDLGGYCFCFEPSNLFLNSYPLWMPFDMQTADGGTKLARAVYNEVPELSSVFGQYKQKLLALFGFDNYGLYTTFDWNSFADIKGRKIGGAGPNLPWIGIAGAIPVGTTLPDVYQSLKTSVYDGMILFPSVGVPNKLYEAAKYYTIVGFGSKAFHGLTVNEDVFSKLPAPVQKAMVEAAQETEAVMGPWVDIEEKKNLDIMKANGATIKTISPEAQKAWAQALADWPNEKAKEADAKGLPGTKAVRLALDHAEKLGHKWPVRYVIK